MHDQDVFLEKYIHSYHSSYHDSHESGERAMADEANVRAEIVRLTERRLELEVRTR